VRGSVVALLAAASVAGFFAVRAAFSSSAPKQSTSLGVQLAADAGLPRSPRPAFRPGTPKLLDPSETVYRWAAVRRETEARAGPSPHAPVIASVATRTPEDTTNIVLVIGAEPVRGALWTRVRLAVLPNNTTGWVPRSALGGYQFVHTHLIVDLTRLTATLFYDRRPIFRAPAGVGQSRWPTPTGSFYVREELSGFSDSFYGPIAFGTSARSSVLTDWPSGGFVGIHGTNQPELIPGRVSHGCVRLRNADILRLARLMPIGTPVTIR
jgi:L,D-transpeptidase catalytic domain